MGIQGRNIYFNNVYSTSNSPYFRHFLGVGKLPPNYAEVIQYIDGPIYQDEVTKNWFFPDKKGDQLRPVHLGGYLDMNGTDNSLSFADLTGITITSWEGTATLTKAVNDITATAGTLEYLTLSNGSIYDFEGLDPAVYPTVLDKLNSLNITLNGTLTSIYQESITIPSYRNLYGYNEGWIGPELTTNGDSLSLADWNVTADSTIIGGVARVLSTTGAFTRVAQTGYGSSQGKMVQIQVNITSQISGQIKVSFAGGTGSNLPTTVGLHTVTRINDGTIGQIEISRVAGITDVSFDLVSVKEIVPVTVDIPRDESPANVALPIKQQKDVLGNTLEFYRRAKYPLQVTENSVVQNNGTDNSLALSDLTGVTIVSSVGTATPTKNVNSIDFTSGIVEQLTLSNGSIYTFAESDGVISYDTVNALDGTWQGTLTNLWQLSDTANPDNLRNGFDLWDNDSTTGLLRVPFRADGTSIKTDGDTITGYTWISRQVGSNKRINEAESTYNQPEAPQLYDVDQQFNTPIFFSAETSSAIVYGDIVPDYEFKHLWFNDVYSSAPSKDKWNVYSTPQTDFEPIQIFVNSVTPYQVTEGDYQTTEGVYYVLKDEV